MREYNGAPEKVKKTVMNESWGCHLTYLSLSVSFSFLIQGVKFHYVECGNANDPAILLLHGFPDCWFGWRHQVNFFAYF